MSNIILGPLWNFSSQKFLGFTWRRSKLVFNDPYVWLVFKILNTTVAQNYFYYKEIATKEFSEKHKSVSSKNLYEIIIKIYLYKM